MKTGSCPKCGAPVEFEPVEMLPNVVPCCDACAERQERTFHEDHRAKAWSIMLSSNMPPMYRAARPERVEMWLAEILRWDRVKHPGGVGIIAPSGAGKSSVIACLIRQLETPFVWWSGTEARDAAIDAATADRDREGLQRVWQHAMTVPILVLDDISQGLMTEAWSSRLFDLLETRIGALLPTFWTSQITEEALVVKIYQQNKRDMAQAQAIARRLGQHSLVISLP